MGEQIGGGVEVVVGRLRCGGGDIFFLWCVRDVGYY
jgi:hypothetical protein